jgi:uncharacterized protein (UPF0264 family)
MAGVVRTVEGRAPVSVALGELSELAPRLGLCADSILPWNISVFKIGLAGCGVMDTWQQLLSSAVRRLSDTSNSHDAKPVAVVYADWQAARAPDPEAVLDAAIGLGCPALLIDTWDKSAGHLFRHWPVNDVRSFVRRVRERNIAAVIAGSLKGESFSTAVRLGPHYVAVRSAACEGGRNGNVSRRRVEALAAAIREAANGNLLPAAQNR